MFHREHVLTIPSPVANISSDAGIRAVHMEPRSRSIIVSKEAIALLAEQGTKVGDDIAGRVAKGTSKPTQGRSDTSGVAITALRIGLRMELAATNRSLLQRERRSIRLLKRQQKNTDTSTNRQREKRSSDKSNATSGPP